MKLPPLCEKAYFMWIHHDTWHKTHPFDKKRFYQFVRTYASFARKNVSGSELKEDIIKRHNGKLDTEYLERKAMYFGHLFDEINEYISYAKE